MAYVRKTKFATCEEIDKASEILERYMATGEKQNKIADDLGISIYSLWMLYHNGLASKKVVDKILESEVK